MDDGGREVEIYEGSVLYDLENGPKVSVHEREKVYWYVNDFLDDGDLRVNPGTIESNNNTELCGVCVCVKEVRKCVERERDSRERHTYRFGMKTTDKPTTYLLTKTDRHRHR